MIKSVIKSISILVLISSIAAFTITSTLLTFIKVWLSVTVLQIIVYSIYTKIIAYLYTIETNKFNLAKIEEYSKQGLNVTCPCPKALKAFIPIRLDQNNYYKCLDCGKNVAVQIDLKTFNQTDILDDSQMQIEFEKAKKELEKLDDTKRTRI